jgi:hypothetical protein
VGDADWGGQLGWPILHTRSWKPPALALPHYLLLDLEAKSHLFVCHAGSVHPTSGRHALYVNMWQLPAPPPFPFAPNAVGFCWRLSQSC